MENTPVVPQSKTIVKKKVLKEPTTVLATINEPVASPETPVENPTIIEPKKKTKVLKKQPVATIDETTIIDPTTVEPKKKSRVLKKPSKPTEPTEATDATIEPTITATINEPVEQPPKKKTKVLKKPLSDEKKTEQKGGFEIVLDERERDLYEEILKIKTDIPISKRVLTIGDVLIQQNEKPLLIIERKSLQDLLASIKDGRYTEQSFRLLNASGLPPHQIMYCIEGMMSSVKSEEEKIRVFSAISSLHFYKGMSVLRTWSVQETAELMVRTAEKIKRETANGKKPYSNSVAIQTDGSGSAGGGNYSQTLTSSVKNENITPKNIGEIMLSQIPSVSVASARALLAVYGGDFIRFIEALKCDDPLLQQVYFEGVSEGGKRRKISGKCLENIRHLLLSSSQ